MAALLGPFLERMVGVSHIKASERESHHLQCSLPRQFDAWIHINTTTAVVFSGIWRFPCFPFFFGGLGWGEGLGPIRSRPFITLGGSRLYAATVAACAC